MNKLNIIFVCAEYPYDNRSKGGFGTYVQHLSEELIKSGHLVTILCQGQKTKIIVRGNLEIRILSGADKRISNSEMPIIQRLIFFLRYPILFSFLVWRELRYLQRIRQIDIVEGGDFGAELFFYLLLGKTSSTKTVIKLHTPSFIIRQYNNEPNSLFYLCMESLEKYCLTHCDKVYSPTKNLAQIISKKYGLIVSTIIPYPVEQINKKLRIKRNEKLVLYAGKIQRKKGVYILTEAIPLVLAVHPRAKFIFVGGDTLSHGLSAQKLLINIIRKNNLDKSINILPAVTKLELYKMFQKAAITVIPSLWENFPNVLLEASIFGSAVIASRVGGIPEMIKQGKTGILVPPQDPQAVANAISKLLFFSSIRNKLSREAKKSIITRYNSKK